MTRNKLLNLAIVICKVVRVFYVALFMLFTGLFIHFQVSPNSYKDAKFNFETSSFTMSKANNWKTNNENGSVPKDKDVYTFEKISKGSLYFIYFQFSALLFFIFLSTKEFQKIMESVKNLKTFQNNNVTSFRKIGKYIFIIFILSSFNFIQFEQGGKSQIHLSLTPLLFMLTAFILAEIFKEGNSLKQENDLTI